MVGGKYIEKFIDSISEAANEDIAKTVKKNSLSKLSKIHRPIQNKKEPLQAAQSFYTIPIFSWVTIHFTNSHRVPS